MSANIRAIAGQLTQEAIRKRNRRSHAEVANLLHSPESVDYMIAPEPYTDSWYGQTYATNLPGYKDRFVIEPEPAAPVPIGVPDPQDRVPRQPAFPGPQSQLQSAQGKIADSGQIATDAMPEYPLQPSGVGEITQLNKAAQSYRSLMKGLDDYDALVKEGGIELLPGPQKDKVAVSHRNLQMQMKELYNLGVLNGPDLELMNTILLNPNGIVNKILDVTGVADTEERVASNVELVRQLMTDLAEPKLRSLGLTPEDMLGGEEKTPPSVSEMSDEQLLEMLTGGAGG